MLILLAQTPASAPLPATPEGADFGPLPIILFYALSLLTLGSAFGVALCRNIIRAAVSLLFALAGMAGLYFLLHAEFLAAVQLVVYVGGTLILMIFGVMLTSKSPAVAYDPKRGEVLWAGILAAAIAIPLLLLLVNVPWPAGVSGGGEGLADAGAPGPSVESLGEALLSPQAYLVPFELVSVLLLAVMIGAAYLAKGRRAEGSKP